MVKKIDFRNPGEGFILKIFKWENPGRKIRGRVFPIITPVKCDTLKKKLSHITLTLNCDALNETVTL